MPRAELRRHTVIVLSVSQSVSQSVCLLQVFLVAHWKLSAETSKTSRYRYLLGSDLKKFGSKASFVSYGVIYLPWLPWLAIWTLLKTKPPTLDFLEACRFHLYYRIAWRVQRNRAKKLWQSLQLSHSRTGIAVTPSWLKSAWLLCLHNCLAVALAKFTVCSVVCQSNLCVQVANISPRHQHLWCYFSVCYISFMAHAEKWSFKLAKQVELDVISLLKLWKFHRKPRSRVTCCWRSGLLLRQNCPHMTAWQLIGSICTTG